MHVDILSCDKARNPATAPVTVPTQWATLRDKTIATTRVGLARCGMTSQILDTVISGAPPNEASFSLGYLAAVAAVAG
jgi:hypothetical protein